MKYIAIAFVAITLLSFKSEALSIEKVDKVENEAVKEVEESVNNSQSERKFEKKILICKFLYKNQLHLVLKSDEFNVFIESQCSEACSIADCTKNMASKICPDQCPEQGVLQTNQIDLTNIRS